MNRGPEGGMGWFRRGKEATGEVRANPDKYMKPYAEDEDTGPNPEDWEAPDSIDDHAELVDETQGNKVGLGKEASVDYRRNDEPQSRNKGYNQSLQDPNKGIRNSSQDRRAGFEKPNGFVNGDEGEQKEAA